LGVDKIKLKREAGENQKKENTVKREKKSGEKLSGTQGQVQGTRNREGGGKR